MEVAPEPSAPAVADSAVPATAPPSRGPAVAAPLTTSAPMTTAAAGPAAAAAPLAPAPDPAPAPAADPLDVAPAEAEVLGAPVAAGVAFGVAPPPEPPSSTFLTPSLCGFDGTGTGRFTALFASCSLPIAW